jgi:hypothetical protein
MKYKYTNHWTCNNIIIIKPTFNDELKNIIYEDNFVHIVFTDYSNLNIGINYYMKKNSDSKITSCLSKFDKSIDNLFNYNKLKYLTFGYSFNQLVDNLPNSIITINFIDCGFCEFYRFNKSLNCLPNSVREIKLYSNYNQEIKKLPINAKIIYR